MKAGISHWMQRIFARRGSACCTRATAQSAQLELPIDNPNDKSAGQGALVTATTKESDSDV
jgi:hypothetical protein